MALVRRDLKSEIRGALADGQLMPDWRWYVRTYPWTFVTAAALAGYLAVPSRRGRTAAAQKPVLDAPEQAASGETPAGQPRGNSRRLRDTAWEIIYPVAIRAAQSYAVHQIEEWIRQQGRQTAPDPARMACECGPPFRRNTRADSARE
jgi:hypothetical protein